MEVTANTGREARIDELRRAVIPVFAAQGYRRTSMADLAQAAGVSRPALYQYFDNRSDLFRAAFQALLEDATDAALAALDGGGTIAERLDAYLQRLSADGYEVLAATPFGDELMEAKHDFAADVAQDALDRAREGLRTFVNSNAHVDAPARRQVIDLLVLSPAGLKGDQPSPALYRERLRSLAAAAAALLAG